MLWTNPGESSAYYYVAHVTYAAWLFTSFKLSIIYIQIFDIAIITAIALLKDLFTWYFLPNLPFSTNQLALILPCSSRILYDQLIYNIISRSVHACFRDTWTVATTESKCYLQLGASLFCFFSPIFLCSNSFFSLCIMLKILLLHKNFALQKFNLLAKSTIVIIKYNACIYDMAVNSNYLLHLSMIEASL